MAVWLLDLQTGCPSPPGRSLVLIPVIVRGNPKVIMWLEGMGEVKNLMTSLGIKPAALKLVAYCLNQV
jgi:hypothetical protein